ncbi:ribbon-helix-helix domain-containing protein [Spirulina sp. CS-785/01]|uniref:ribbon-helix-helix domain-containing protein n=1 Tax=Spirulina sp. CS-785/01 TaxID=3021716 RepID=UPI00232F93B0|nr:CopG family transcriptional regulator [Spirulina sp. CS-785/01]MDB9311650.1 ribbon-helix-helix domain-containing protein [Spirulina sp. CS-785/01]
MQDKQKVTLYLPPDLHRRLKIKAAVDINSMSAMVEKAVVFYLQHPEAIDELEAGLATLEGHGNQGQTHRVYSCPECHSSLVQRDGELVSLKDQPSVLSEDISEDVPVEQVRDPQDQQESSSDSQGEESEETLVPC